jgi:hypothetical protein
MAMKKMFYMFNFLMFSVLIINSANADTKIVMGMGGPQVVTNFAPPANSGPIIGGGGINSSPNMGSVPTAVVTQTGDVTNVIMCDPAHCSSGAFSNSADFYVPQITPKRESIWGGPGTTKYDFNSQTFTIEYPSVEVEESILNSDGTTTKVVVISPGKKTIYKNFIDSYNAVYGTERIFPNTNQIMKDITATNNLIVQNLVITKSEDISNAEIIIRNSQLNLLVDNIETVLALIGDWNK